MSHFSRESTLPSGGCLPGSYKGISFTLAAASHGLYLAMVIGIIIILAIGSILAIQMRPHTAPPGKTLGGRTDQPRLVDSTAGISITDVVMRGGDHNGRII
jgi:hypothetical protein